MDKEVSADSQQIWEEFDNPTPLDIEAYEANLSRLVAPEVVARLRTRGILISSIHSDKKLNILLAPDSPAQRFWQQIQSDTSKTEEQRVEDWQAFYLYTFNETNDDHYRAQMPELF